MNGIFTLARQRVIFAIMLPIGAIGGLTLGMYEVLNDPVLEVSDPRDADPVQQTDGTYSVNVKFSVENTSETDLYCPQAGAAALDREGLDLIVEFATADEFSSGLYEGPEEAQFGQECVPPGKSLEFEVDLVGISEEDKEEELDEIEVFVEEDNKVERTA